MLKVTITGPECSGKTTFASDLAMHYSVPYVHEFAREYLEGINRQYNMDDLLWIAIGQSKREQQFEHTNLLICDTGLLVIKVWSQVKYNFVDPKILALLEASKPDLYILPHFDIPYVEDPLREHPTQREELYEQYIREINQLGVPWISVSGERRERVELARNIIDPLISTKT